MQDTESTYLLVQAIGQYDFNVVYEKEQKILKNILNIIGVLLILGGGIWFLQGINVLPGSFMTGQIQWAVYGGIAMIAGIGLLFGSQRQQR